MRGSKAQTSRPMMTMSISTNHAVALVGFRNRSRRYLLGRLHRDREPDSDSWDSQSDSHSISSSCRSSSYIDDASLSDDDTVAILRQYWHGVVVDVESAMVGGVAVGGRRASLSLSLPSLVGEIDKASFR